MSENLDVASKVKFRLVTGEAIVWVCNRESSPRSWEFCGEMFCNVTKKPGSFTTAGSLLFCPTLNGMLSSMLVFDNLRSHSEERLHVVVSGVGTYAGRCG